MAKTRYTPEQLKQHAEKIAVLKARIEQEGTTWLDALKHASAWNMTTYPEDRLSDYDLNAISRYLVEPICSECKRLHTVSICPRCNKPLCWYCYHSTLDMSVTACKECSQILRKEQADYNFHTTINENGTVLHHWWGPLYVSHEMHSQEWEECKQQISGYFAQLEHESQQRQKAVLA